MKKVLSFIAVTVYGVIASVLLWYLFHIATPWLMSFGWIAVVIYYIFLLGLIPTAFAFIGNILFMPIMGLIRIAPSSTYLPICALLWEGYYAAKYPWTLDMDYTVVKVIIAISITLAAISVFAGLIFTLHAVKQIKD